jgi:hypothetical protein
MENQSPFKWRHFETGIILQSVRWYLHSALSYHALEEMMLAHTSSLEKDGELSFPLQRCYCFWVAIRHWLR